MFNAYSSIFKRKDAKSQEFFALSVLFLSYRFVRDILTSLIKDKRFYILDNRSFYLIKKLSIGERRRVLIAEARLSPVGNCSILIIPFLIFSFSSFPYWKAFVYMLLRSIFAPAAVLVG